MPESLQVRSGAAMQQLSRGLHQVNAYTLQAHVTARWATLADLRPHATVEGSRMQCGAPILMLAVGDARGIRAARVEVDGQPLALKPGTFHPTYTRGLHTPLPESLRGRGEPLSVSVDLELVGTERLSIVPPGGQHRRAVAEQLAAPVVRGPLPAVGAHDRRRWVHGALAPLRAGHHSAVGRGRQPAALRNRGRYGALRAARRGRGGLRRRIRRVLHRSRQSVLALGPRHEIRRAVHRAHLRGRGPVRVAAAAARAPGAVPAGGQRPVQLFSCCW